MKIEEKKNYFGGKKVCSCFGYSTQEKKVADLGTFGGFVLNFTMFIY